MPRNDSPPFVSIVTPVHNGVATLDRALKSVRRQTLADWELILVDDGSADGTKALAQSWAGRDARITLICHDDYQGEAAARNTALRQATGQLLAYLDCEDELYPDYLEQLAGHGDKADVLVSRYDVLQQGQLTSWDPRPSRNDLFLRNLSAPLGVAHARKLVQQAGYFNEALWRELDWDYWKRLARRGATFVFLAAKSGICHVRPGKASRAPGPTPQQLQAVQSNREARLPIFATAADSRSPRARRLLFASMHCLADASSGAAIATRRQLQLLTTLGFSCQAFCGDRLDAEESANIAHALHEQNISCRKLPTTDAPDQGRWLIADCGFPLTIFQTCQGGGRFSSEELNAFLTYFDQLLHRDRPDALLAYGADPITRGMINLAKRRDVAIVFCLHNLAYRSLAVLRKADYVIVPSEFAREHYWKQLGLDCQVLPNAIDVKSIASSTRRPEYLTFVNPQPAKGLHYFAAIANELSKLRPDIPVLVVEGRAGADWIGGSGLSARVAARIRRLRGSVDPREFHGQTRVLLMPSLVEETFGLVAAEAMLNGIPVLVSNRGALPETVGDAGFHFRIPDCYAAKSELLPNREDIQPWIGTILRLWDDPDFYEQASERAREQAQQWLPARLASLYEAWFSAISPQPGPPLL